MPAPAPAEIVLVVPGLLGPVPRGAGDAGALRALTDGLELDALERLLARADAVPAIAGGDPDALALDALGVAPCADADVPAGALGRLADGGEPADGWCLRLDPVHLRAEPAGLTLIAARELAVGADEARALAREIEPALPAGARLETPAPDRWYLRLDAPAAIRTTPVGLAHGRSVDPMLPRGPAAREWHARLNEIQMILHASPVNAAREAAGARPINSVWPWGGGALPAIEVPPRASAAWATSATVRGAAALAGIPCSQPPPDPHALLAAGGGRRVVVIETLHGRAAGADVEGWRDGVAALERDVLAPLLAALRARRGVRLEVRAGEGLALAADARALGRWWRRARPLGEAAARLRARAPDQASSA